MKLCDLLTGIHYETLMDDEVTGLTNKSDEVKPGYLFFAYQGSRLDGYDYIPEAFSKGAVAVISDRPYPDKRVFVVEQMPEIMATLAYTFYHFPQQDLQLIGITGTNGKTSTAWIIYQTLTKLNCPSMYIGTIGCYASDFYQSLENTTPDALTLAKLLSIARKKQIQVVVMEVSSHSLALNRVFHLFFDIGVFTNLSHEHLDFHHTINDYLNAKKKLFSRLKPDGIAVINGDDEHSDEIINGCPNVIVKYGQKTTNNEIFSVLKDSMEGLEINYLHGILKSNLVTEMNAYNLTAAYVTCELLGYESSEVFEQMKSIPSIPGRIQRTEYNGIKIIIDFAHTPDAMEKILQYIKKSGVKRLFTVFGCGGNRDKTKRPIMGQIATRYSDYTFVTSDNPRYEDPQVIISEITAPLDSSSFYAEVDRKKAIFYALDMAKEGDVIAILGKGNEEYQIIQGTKIPYLDEGVVEEWIQQQKS